MSGINMFDMIAQAAGGSAVQQVSQKTGLPPDMAQAAIKALLPAIAGGVQRNVQQPGGLGPVAVGSLEGAPHQVALMSLDRLAQWQRVRTLAAELPVVAVEASGTQDVVEESKQGLLVDNDSEALAKGIDQVLSDDALLGQFKEATLARAEYFDMTRQAERMVEVYHQAIEDQRAERLVRVDKAKKIFDLIIDEQKLEQFFGLSS